MGIRKDRWEGLTPQQHIELKKVAKRMEALTFCIADSIQSADGGKPDEELALWAVEQGLSPFVKWSEERAAHRSSYDKAYFRYLRSRDAAKAKKTLIPLLAACKEKAFPKPKSGKRKSRKRDDSDKPTPPREIAAIVNDYVEQTNELLAVWRFEPSCNSSHIENLRFETPGVVAESILEAASGLRPEDVKRPARLGRDSSDSEGKAVKKKERQGKESKRR